MVLQSTWLAQNWQRARGQHNLRQSFIDPLYALTHFYTGLVSRRLRLHCICMRSDRMREVQVLNGKSIRTAWHKLVIKSWPSASSSMYPCSVLVPYAWPSHRSPNKPIQRDCKTATKEVATNAGVAFSRDPKKEQGKESNWERWRHMTKPFVQCSLNVPPLKGSAPGPTSLVMAWATNFKMRAGLCNSPGLCPGRVRSPALCFQELVANSLATSWIRPSKIRFINSNHCFNKLLESW